MREQVQQLPGNLGARLRNLRERYPTLAITTEIIHHTDRLITFRATIVIDALVRAQGHAAQRAEPTGAFVMAAEAMAVEQALLLGGFALPNDGAQAAAVLEQELSLPPQVSPAAVRSKAPNPGASISAPSPEPDTTASEADDGTGPTGAKAQALPSVAITDTTDEANTVNSAMSPAAIDPTPPRAPRPKRDRRAERARTKARAANATLPNDAEDNLTVPTDPPTLVEETTSADVAMPAPAPELTPAAEPTTDEVVSIQPTLAALAVDEPAAAPAPVSAPETDAVMATPTPPAAPRKSRTRSASTSAVATTPAKTVTADAPTTREALRESWQVGRPIPAWWPQSRPIVNQSIGKSRVGRLRALALDEEISTSLLDTYSTLLFGTAVAALDQTQSMILEERLNPAYPSPLEELRVRRILHPLAVSDEMTIAEDQPFFVRWSDVPPVEEEPEPPAPPTITWRERGKKGGGRRR